MSVEQRYQCPDEREPLELVESYHTGNCGEKRPTGLNSSLEA